MSLQLLTFEPRIFSVVGAEQEMSAAEVSSSTQQQPGMDGSVINQAAAGQRFYKVQFTVDVPFAFAGGQPVSADKTTDQVRNTHGHRLLALNSGWSKFKLLTLTSVSGRIQMEQFGSMSVCSKHSSQRSTTTFCMLTATRSLPPSAAGSQILKR